MTHRFSYTFQSVQAPDSRQHMGRNRALTTSGFEQTLGFEMSQQHIEKLHFLTTSQQASAKFAEHQKVKAGIAQLEG